MRAGCSRRGALLIEALVSLAILGIVIAFGAGFFARRRDLERERLDREVALRALATEWVFVRTAGPGELRIGERSAFIGPAAFVEGLDPRSPELSVKESETRGLYLVRLTIGHGVRTTRHIVQEGYVFVGGGGE